MSPRGPWAGRLGQLELAPRKAGGGVTAGRERHVLSPEACWDSRGCSRQARREHRCRRSLGQLQRQAQEGPVTLSLLESAVLQESWSRSAPLPSRALCYLCVPPPSMALLLSRPLSQAASSWGSCPGTVPPLPQPEFPLCHLPCCFGLCPLESLSSAPLGAWPSASMPRGGEPECWLGPGLPPRRTPSRGLGVPLFSHSPRLCSWGSLCARRGPPGEPALRLWSTPGCTLLSAPVSPCLLHKQLSCAPFLEASMKPQRRQASLCDRLATLTCSHSSLSVVAGRPVH